MHLTIKYVASQYGTCTKQSVNKQKLDRWMDGYTDELIAWMDGQVDEWADG